MKPNNLEIEVKKLDLKDNDVIVFNVDVGSMSEKKAVEYLQKLMEQYKNKMENDNNTIWLCHRNGKLGSDVSNFPLCKTCLKTLKDLQQEMLNNGK